MAVPPGGPTLARQHSVAALLPNLQGIRIAKLAWLPDVIADKKTP